MSAKELCALLITKSLKNLNEDEEEIVIDYLTDLGYDVDIDTKPQELCRLLLNATMKKELKKEVPISAYANSLLDKGKVLSEQKNKLANEKALEASRIQKRKELENKSKVLPGCNVNNDKLISKNLYDLIVDQELGYSVADDTHSAIISISENLYTTIFMKLNDPIVEITSNKGNKAYARVGEYHQENDSTIYISQLVADILDINDVNSKNNKNVGGFLKLCNSLPEITHIGFTYYGSQEKLDEDLPMLIEKLPKVINGFSYLSLGMILYITTSTSNITIRVDSLLSFGDEEIFAGIIPLAENDLPFDINADI